MIKKPYFKRCHAFKIWFFLSSLKKINRKINKNVKNERKNNYF